MKVCCTCKENKPNNSFYRKNSGKDGLQSRCKLCIAEYLDSRNNEPTYDGLLIKCSTCRLEKRKADFYPDKRQKQGLRPQCKLCNRGTALKRKFGISLQDYQNLLHAQDYSCAICKSSMPSGSGDFHVDHDHKTKKIRGLLCSNCNTGLGLFKDSQDALLNAIAYLRKSNV